MSASKIRESALSEMLGRLGNTESPDERYNNGFAHFSLAVHSSYARAFEKRMATFVRMVNVTIKEAVPVVTKKNSGSDSLVGKTILIERPIFENTMTLTDWIENFYQESPSINARAREDQVTIGSEAFKTTVFSGFQHGERDAATSLKNPNR